MKLVTRDRLSSGAIIGIAVSLIIIVAFSGVLLWALFAEAPVKLDANLCPKETGPIGTTLLLLDTTDPLGPKHRAELARLARELKGQDGESGIAVHEGYALVVYVLETSVANLQPKFKVCNPGGDPSQWTWKDDLTQGKAFALSHWTKFENRLNELFPEQKRESEVLDRSPILETLAAVVPYYAVRTRRTVQVTVPPIHLIIFSDFLQHTERLSHYGKFPDAREFVRQGGELVTDLSGVDVSLLYLRRDNYAKWQTADHYFWWTKLVEAMGGTVRMQSAL